MELSDAETELWNAFPAARTVDLGGTGEIRAEVIAALLLGAQRAEPGRVPTVHLVGARITGPLDLSYAEVRHALLLRDCEFTDPVDLAGARTKLVNVAKSRLPGLSVSDSQIGGLLILGDARIDGPLNLTGTQVEGIVSMRYARLSDVRADSLSVSRALVLAGMTVNGEFRMQNANVGGPCHLNEVHLRNPGHVALMADGITIAGGLMADRAFTCDGELRLANARIGHTVALTGAQLRNPGSVALNAAGVRVDGSFYLDGGFRADGRVTLRSATIGGDLALGDADLTGHDGIALDAVSLDANGVTSVPGLRATGELNFGAARIRESITLTGAKLANPGGQAFSLHRAEVGGGVICDFTAEGEVRLLEARVGGTVHFKGARLTNPGGRTLNALELTANGMVSCCEGFTSDGRVVFSGARLGGVLCFNGATFDSLVCWQTSARTLRLRRLTVRELDLRHARVDVLLDDPANLPERAFLDGFTYETLETPGTGNQRLDWLDGDGYHPQPYERLAAVYRSLGQDGDVRVVQLAKQRRRRKTQPRWARFWGYAQDYTVGYGYRPQWAGLWLAGLLVVGWVAFAAHNPQPLKADEAPQFNPLLYTLDLLLPIISFGQDSAFDPHGWWQWLAALLVASGWILATTIAAGVTRVLSRQ